MLTRLTKHRQIRFVLVGIINTAIDFSIYSVLIWLAVNVFLANLLSTSAGMVVSFVLNRHFTFKAAHTGSQKQLPSFIAVTVVGQWLIQPTVIYLAHSLLRHIDNRLPYLEAYMAAKIIAIGVSLCWNYAWYSRVVFASRPPSQ